MKFEDKKLLLKDIFPRLFYGVKGLINEWEGIITFRDIEDLQNNIKTIKPYLRPMSSMTEEEKGYLMSLKYQPSAVKWKNLIISSQEIIDWLNAHHFDYRGLIENDLAVEVTKNNNPYER